MRKPFRVAGLLTAVVVVVIAVRARAATIDAPISTDTTLSAANSPYTVVGDLSVVSPAILAIEPGVTLFFAPGADVTVAAGGRIVAEGAATEPIRFTRAPGSTSRWGGLTINGGAGSPESRLRYAHLEFNGDTAIHAVNAAVVLDHLTFGATDRQYVSLDGSSFVISHCYFPSGTTEFELLHGAGGVKAGGVGIVRDCFFGSPRGYKDTMDFTGGNRPNQPIIQFCNNVFVGGTDDILDLDGTDAWIEGNLFLHVHRNGSPDSASAVSGGNDSSRTSEMTIVRNLFFDCDNAVTAKEGNFYTLLHNTIVRTTKTGGVDEGSGVVNVRDLTPDVTTFGRGAYLEANIVVDAEALVRNYDAQQTTITFQDNILPVAWNGPGSSNTVGDPLLKHLPDLAETQFTSWDQAQIMWDWFGLRPESPARGAGLDGRDLGAVIEPGATISGEPSGVTSETSATLTVGFRRVGNGIPTAGWPSGAGYTHYKWRLDTGPWSPETPISQPLSLTHLSDGAHHVEVVGKRDSGMYQDDPLLGTNAVVTSSRTWVVQRVPIVTMRAGSRMGNEFSLEFNAHAGVTYTVQYSETLSPPSWRKLLDVTAQPSSGAYPVTDGGADGPRRFYRVVSPAQP